MSGLQRLQLRLLQQGAAGEALAAVAGGEAAAARALARTLATGSARSFAVVARQACRPAGLSFAAASLQKASTRQFGFAASALRAGCRCAGRPAVANVGAALKRPVGLGGSSLAVARAAGRRLKSSIVHEFRSHPNAAEAYGPAALTAGLTPGQRRQLAVWLGACSAWVFVLVVVGGITRLTRSGLSMTSWKFTGEKPPSTPEEWEEEFARYKRTPEYVKTNQGMTVEEFKFIYFWEWGHRMWGRALGFVVAVPAAYFASRGMVNGALGRRLALLFLMGGTQGLVGWWMVRSGFQEPEDNQVPRVSTYRMAGHLATAFTIFAALVWTTLSVAVPISPTMAAGPEAAHAARLLGRWAHPLAALIGITAMSGCFVAGKDAGRAYNTWPDMNGEWFPSEYWSERLPALRNLFENTAAVQFNHRTLAYASLAGVVSMWRYGTQLPALPRASRLVLHALAAATACQVALGITTLLTYVPVPLGAAHQGGAMVLFTLMLGLLYTIKPTPSLGTFRLLLAKYGSTATAAAVVGIGGTVVNMH
ncbi:cytochrome c oxidase assembly COX15 [Micractinium conductrix]|uniref:Cytochrome c oxidase assembly COX15 n=1 Tax=Micractinium conductrix TaxID=554055 RepID=A0A2P6VMB8_9CHLO|nr:cytochrome c oxidase assembly COX15 [Micractinium conductrix]|eukprot:PSC75229.1 cytochrome c oxidase assembly COX15 [Micractinium conductrix]